MLEAKTKEPVYILIPVYNRKQTTLTCLENLNKRGDLQRYHIVIVDDGSTDGTTAAINSLYPDVIVLPGTGNLWWTGAMAKAMEYAYRQGAEYFIWLNDDCTPEEKALSRLVEFMRSHPDTIVAPTCYSYTNNSLVQQHNAFIGRKSCAANPGEILYVDGISGWCAAIPASVFAKIGAPDTYRFPHYSGDDTYILRATRSGFKACVIGDIKVTLFGAVHPKLNFSSYFHPRVTALEIWQELFWSKKSPYRLPTLFFYQTERYGLFLGILFFTIKLIFWLKEWARLQIAIWFKSKIKIGNNL